MALFNHGAPDSNDDAMDHGATDIPKWQEALQSNQTLNDEANSSEDGQDSSELHASVNPTNMEGVQEDQQSLTQLMVDNFPPHIVAQMQTIFLTIVRGAILVRDNNNMEQVEQMLQEIDNVVYNVLMRDDGDIVEDDNIDV